MVAKQEPLVIITRHKHGVTELRLNRPSTSNAFSTTLYNLTTSHLRALSKDTTTRIILLTGTGKTFSSGMDIKEASSANTLSIIEAAEAFMHALLETPQPIVAAVFGSVTGIGVTLLLHCSLVFCAHTATFHTPFPYVGLVPEFGSSITFPTMLGARRTTDLLLLGRTLRAGELGDVFRVVHGSRAEVIAVARQECEDWSKECDEEQWRCVQESRRVMASGMKSRVEEEMRVIRGLVAEGVTGRLLRARVDRLARL